MEFGNFHLAGIDEVADLATDLIAVIGEIIEALIIAVDFWEVLWFFDVRCLAFCGLDRLL